MGSDPNGTAAWYGRAAVELAQTSELQVEWARGIAADPDVVALIDELPRGHRQPSLVLSVARWLGAPAGSWPELREWLIASWPRVEAAARGRRTQTNEVGRCAPLLAALDRIPGPLALVEVGASAGLCLGVDRYAYRFDDGPVIGDGDPLLTCVTSGAGSVPTRLPDVVWRRGVDLAPLSLTDPDDVSWLEALLPPDRPERLARLRAASARLSDDPPPVVAGDALEALPGLAAAAPAGASLVVVALGTLVYLDPAALAEVLRLSAELGARLVTLEPVAALPEIQQRLAGLAAPHPTPFVVALDGEPLAYASAHGDRLSWLSPVGQPDAGETAS
ncbi:MAG: DUF2332 domain-containing protein [Pseudolysinimonas sp.]